MINIELKVLIVDDLPISRRIMRALMKEIGFEHIVEAVDGFQALKTLQANNDFGLVLSDWNMPVMSGMDLLMRVRADQKLKDLPFVLITAEANKEKMIEAIKAGVDAYIVKPVSSNILREKLNKVVLK